MNSIKIIIGIVLFLASTLTQANELSQNLKSDNFVLLIRHTTAPGYGDPENYSLNDCNTQRNLSEEGRQQARAIGNWLRKEGITHAEVYSSPWCRCKDTAELLSFGRPIVVNALASFFNESRESDNRTRQLESLISQKLKTKGDQALILVTHHVNILGFFGQNVGSGDMVLAKVDKTGKMVSYKTILRPE